MIYTVDWELTWFRLIGQDWHGKTCTREIEITKHDVGDLEILGLGLGKSEKEAREVISLWLLAMGIYDPQGFWSDIISITDFDCQIELSDGCYVRVYWEEDKNYAEYQKIMLS